MRTETIGRHQSGRKQLCSPAEPSDSGLATALPSNRGCSPALRPRLLPNPQLAVPCGPQPTMRRGRRRRCRRRDNVSFKRIVGSRRGFDSRLRYTVRPEHRQDTDLMISTRLAAVINHRQPANAQTRGVRMAAIPATGGPCGHAKALGATAQITSVRVAY